MSAKLFVTGIGTEVGKTVVSSLLVRALEADYWKPVQAGDLHHTDTDKVREWSGQNKSVYFPEAYRLIHPMSPHAAAALEGATIDVAGIQLPKTDRPLVVEGAGGLYVPLNERETMLDLIQHLGLPVVLVSRHYLGSINHTLLSISALRQKQIPIAALIFNGAANPATESVIEQISGVRSLLRVGEMTGISAEAIADLASEHSPAIRGLLTGS